MKLFHVNFDSQQANKILENSIKYSYGFLEGIEIEKIIFNQMLSEYVIEVLNKYIDSRARTNPNMLHHVYEWGQVGVPSARLFKIEAKASKKTIHFYGTFLPSNSISQTSSEPFVDKARIMEEGISIIVEPRGDSPLVFEEGGETIFTMNSIYINNPGGDEVSGSFAKVIESFFSEYLTNAVLQPFMKSLSVADEFTQGFQSGANGAGRSAGINAGKKYMQPVGVVVE